MTGPGLNIFNSFNPPGHAIGRMEIKNPKGGFIMANEQESRFALLPVYLVLDTSIAMNDGAFISAFEFLPMLLNEMHKSALLTDILRVEVITFDEVAKVVFPLGTREELRNWLEEKQSKPIIPDGNWTKYGIAFKKLREEIEHGVQQIRSENYKAYRSIVFFITAGDPSDNKSSRDAAFMRLTDKSFKARPNIICVGVGDATVEKLKEYSAGRYQSPSSTYITGNSKLVLVAKDGVSSSDALAAIIPALVLASDGPGEMEDFFSDNEESLFDELLFDEPLFDEEIFDVFEQDD